MKKTIAICFLLLFITCVGTTAPVNAQPYGMGVYGSNVPYGDQTSLSIATNGNVSIAVTPTSGGTEASGTNNVTVTSTDVIGYKLYVRATGSSDMNNLGATLSASPNISPASLGVDTWGFNTDGSTNFLGMRTSDTLLTSVSGPVSSGNTTTVTYGVNVDLAKPAGDYVASILYTAVPQTN